MVRVALPEEAYEHRDPIFSWVTAALLLAAVIGLWVASTPVVTRPAVSVTPEATPGDGEGLRDSVSDRPAPVFIPVPWRRVKR